MDLMFPKYTKKTHFKLFAVLFIYVDAVMDLFSSV